jgi:uncharacterized protein
VRRCTALAAFVLAVAASACSQTAPAAPAAAPSATKDAKIRELINLMGTPKVAVEMMKSEVASLKKLMPFPPAAQDDFEKEFLASIHSRDLVDMIVPIYDRHFSEKDVDAMLVFYRSPVGQHFIQALPQITAESQKVGAEWGRNLGMKVGRKIGERIERGDYGPPPAHQDDLEKH